MAWHGPGDKPLSEPMMVNLLAHICTTRPQWVNLKTSLLKYCVKLFSSVTCSVPCYWTITICHGCQTNLGVIIDCCFEVQASFDCMVQPLLITSLWLGSTTEVSHYWFNHFWSLHSGLVQPQKSVNIGSTTSDHFTLAWFNHRSQSILVQPLLITSLWLGSTTEVSQYWFNHFWSLHSGLVQPQKSVNIGSTTSDHFTLAWFNHRSQSILVQPLLITSLWLGSTTEVSQYWFNHFWSLHSGLVQPQKSVNIGSTTSDHFTLAWFNNRSQSILVQVKAYYKTKAPVV